MEITLQVIKTPSNHTLSSEKEKYRASGGDVIAAHLTSEVPEPPSPNSRSVFLRIPDFPNEMASSFKTLGKRYVRTFINELGEPDTEELGKWQMNIDLSLLTVKETKSLDTSKEVNIPWSRLQSLVKNRETNSLIKVQDF